MRMSPPSRLDRKTDSRMADQYPEYAFAKRILGRLGIFDPAKTGSMSSKNVFLRRVFRFFGLYPNMRM